jgi:hypothetical protein
MLLPWPQAPAAYTRQGHSYIMIRAHAAQVTDPDGYSLEFVYKSWQHGKLAAA